MPINSRLFKYAQNFWMYEKFKGDETLCIIHTNKNLNIPALNCYITSFDICLYKRDIASENVIRYYGTPCIITIY